MDARERKINILLVDDDQSIRDFLVRFLKFEGLKAVSVDSGYKALELAQKEKFDLVFLDIKMPGMSGLEIYNRLKKFNPRLGCVFMTGYALEEALIEKAKQPGIVCLKKPFDDIANLKASMYKVLEEIQAIPEAQKSANEKRAFSRFDISLGVEYRMKDELVSPEDPAELFKGRVTEFIGLFSKDISPSGMGMIIPQSIALGTILELVIKAKDDKIKPCRAFAEVIWSKESPDKPGDYEVGLEFIKIDYAVLAEVLIRSGCIAMI